MALNFLAPSAWLVWAIIVPTVLGTVPIIYAQIRAGQSGCKLTPRLNPEDVPGGQPSTTANAAHPGRGDDKYWKLGMFYHNPEDPALLVENRFGGNGGFNYARPAAKAVVAALAITLAALYAVITWFAIKEPIM